MKKFKVPTRSLSYLILLITVGCGSGYQEVVVKDYRIGVATEDSEIKDAIADLIEEYNRDVGCHVLSYETDIGDANSPILITKGIQERDGKVGWGQWILTTETETPSRFLMPSGEARRYLNYSMRLELDQDYVTQRVRSDDRSLRYDLKKLVYHEVGHGLKMDHHNNPQDLMYYDISGVKDFAVYYQKVREFMGCV